MVLVLSALGSVVVLVVAAAWSDWHGRRIPHWPVAVLAAGWAVAAVAAPDLLGGPPLAGFACGGFALAAGLVLRGAGWVGGGDVKLAAALGLWLGPADFGLALLAAGVLTLGLASAVAVGGGIAPRGVPLACALVPPAVVLLLWRAAVLAAPASAG